VSEQLWSIAPDTYCRHPVHLGEGAWPESNCSVDVWIELLNAAGLDPMATLPFTIAIDFEGDQWTFFKIPYADLYALYGIEVVEVNVWRALAVHLEDQLKQGRPCLVEVDAHHLPDTAGTSYQREHVKTSIAVQALDAESRRLGYFHNAGYYELTDGAFDALFASADSDPRLTPPIIEIVKRPAQAHGNTKGAARASLDLLRVHLTRRPQDNPFLRYAPRLVVELERLAAGSLDSFHRYAFATFRQFGSAFELAGAYLRWLETCGEADLERPAAACDTIATTAKALQFKTARLVSTRRTFDAVAMLETMAGAWEDLTARLSTQYGAAACSG